MAESENATEAKGIFKSKPWLWLLVIGAIILILLAIILPIVFLSAKGSGKCSTSTCKNEIARIKSQIDPKTSPCDDFYQFVCGNYINKNYNASIESIDTILQQAQDEVVRMYNDPITDDDHLSVKFVKKIFKACMDVAAIENDNLETFKQALATIGGGWPLMIGTEWNATNFNWLNATYALRTLGYEFSIFLDLNARPDPQNATKSIFQVRIPFDLDEATDSVSHKKSVMKKIALAFGVNLHNTTKELKKLYEFAEEITDQMLDHRGLSSYPIMPIRELQKMLPFINWLEYINTIGGPLVEMSEGDDVIVVEADTLRQRFDLLRKIPKRTQANYMMWKVIQETLPYLTPVMQDLLSEDDAKEPRSQFCQQEIEKRFPISPIDILYARKYAPKEKKEAIEELVDKIRETFLQRLENVSWLSASDKQNVEDKTRNLGIVIGEVGDYFDDTILESLIGDLTLPDTDNFLHLLTTLNRNFVSQSYGKVTKSTIDKLSQRKSFVLPYDIYYYPELNVLRVPTTQLKIQNFGKDQPSYLNYAMLGKDLGKEFGGLLKLSASYFDKFGNKIMGWSTETSERYGKTSECLINNMESFKKITFDFMLIEMQGSVAGVKLAYDSFTRNNKEEFLLEDLDYNANQLFWISTVACYPNNTEDYDLSYLPDTRDLPRNIVYATVRNNPNFAQDFQCTQGTPMNPVSKCELI